MHRSMQLSNVPALHLALRHRKPLCRPNPSRHRDGSGRNRQTIPYRSPVARQHLALGLVFVPAMRAQPPRT